MQVREDLEGIQMEAATTRRREVTNEELREAEKGLVRLLHKKRFPREWIERNVPDVMAQARTDFAARLAAGKEDDTVNLLVVIGYRRAVKLLDTQLSRPPTTSIESVFHLADDSTPTPEQEAIDHDRQERVMKAMAHLGDRERKLMALVYFDGKSVRDAGRRLGWGKSSADRHHRAALEKLHELLDRSLLSPELPIPAYIAARHWQNSPLRAAERWVQGASETVIEGMTLGSGRVGQAAEGASVAASSGAGRAAAGVCGAAVAVCLTGAATGVVGPIDSAEEIFHPTPQQGEPPRADRVPTPLSASPPDFTHPAATGDEPGSSGRPLSTKPGNSNTRGGSTNVTEIGKPESRDRRRGNVSPAPAATPKETVDEFGLESRELNSGQESAPAPAAPPEPSPAPTPSARAAPRSAPSISGSSSGSSAGTEFGM